MVDKHKEFLELEYAKKVAKSESRNFTEGYFKRKTKNLELYSYDKILMAKHQKFMKYIYSTFEKYIIHRTIIIYYFENINCSISVLKNTINISKTSLVKIINDSKEEGWLSTEININNKRQTLITPTSIRIKFWLLYCKEQYEQRKLVGVDNAYKALYDYERQQLKNNK